MTVSRLTAKAYKTSQLKIWIGNRVPESGHRKVRCYNPMRVIVQIKMDPNGPKLMIYLIGLRRGMTVAVLKEDRSEVVVLRASGKT